MIKSHHRRGTVFLYGRFRYRDCDGPSDVHQLRRSTRNLKVLCFGCHAAMPAPAASLNSRGMTIQVHVRLKGQQPILRCPYPQPTSLAFAYVQLCRDFPYRPTF